MECWLAALSKILGYLALSQSLQWGCACCIFFNAMLLTKKIWIEKWLGNVHITGRWPGDPGQSTHHTTHST